MDRIDFIAIREAKGMSRAKFAASIDVSEPLVKRLELHDPRGFSPRIRAKLAAGYGVSIDSIPVLGGETVGERLAG